MIGEHEIAAGFHSFWGETLPLLTPSCVSLFNRQFGDYLQGFRPVDREIDLQGLTEPDLMAEAAFETFRSATIQAKRYAAVLSDADELARIWEVASGNIARHRNVNVRRAPQPTDLDHAYLSALGRRYEALAGMFAGTPPELSPRLTGCGVLGVCEADLSYAQTLVEIKTVDRNFSSKDIKQVIIYLALDHVAGTRRWNEVLLFNPRRSYFVRFSPADFVSYIAGGKPAALVYRDIEDFLIYREFMPEHRF